MSEDLERRLDVLSEVIRDLATWLKIEHMEGHRRTDAALGLLGLELRDHAKQLADLKVDVHDHGRRLAALEAKARPDGA